MGTACYCVYWELFKMCSAQESANTEGTWAEVVVSQVFSRTSGKLLKSPQAWIRVAQKGNVLIFLNFMFFADLLRIYKGGPFFRQIWHNWIPVGFGSKSIFESKGGGKLRSGSEFWYSEKISYYMMTFTTFFRDSETKAKKLMGGTWV